MTPRQYEELAADYFRRLGYQIEITPFSGDYGVDIFATNENEKVAIQAKMYGNARKINRQCVMELYGACQYFDCSRAVIVTDGEFLTDALKVAAKLNIQIIYLEDTNRDLLYIKDDQILSFDCLWERYIIPLQGHTLTKSNGETNTIIVSNWAGIERVTSNGKSGKIKIEIFKLAINQLIAKGSITRDEINQQYTGRASSGIILILSQIPVFELQLNPVRLVLKM